MTTTARRRGRGALTVRGLVILASLVVAWVALWGEASIANVASGLVVALCVAALGIGTPARGGLRPAPLARFAWLVALDLVASTISVAREILTPTDHTEEGIIAVRTPTGTEAHLLLLVVAVTVTPGTAVVDADPDTGTLYLHLLHIDRRRAVTEHVIELAELACRALPVDTPPPDTSPVRGPVRQQPR